MRKGIFVILACALLSANALADNTQATDFVAKIQPALSDILVTKGENDKIRVIVSLAADQPKGRSKAQAIAEAQDRVIGAFRQENNGLGLGVLARYQTLFGFSAELTRGQIKALAKRADVTFIEEMPVHEKLYTESHPLTDVDLAQGSYDGTGSVIAFIDDGIDDTHPAFSGKLLGGYDFADFDNDPTIDCLSQSHGTAVAGVALGNSPGVVGVAPGARMVFLKIQGSNICGSNSLNGDIVGAIDWATANKDTYGIDVISMSLGGGLYSSESSCDGSSNSYFTAIRNAVNAGITVIAASGNDGMCDAISRPACFSDVVSVGAVYDENLGTIGWCVSSNSCANTSFHSQCFPGRAAFEDAYADNVIVYSNSATFLDVAAPATCAKSAAPNNGTTDCFGGTSSATPFTSGTAALAVEAAGKGTLTPEQMRTVLVGTGDPVTDPKNGRITPRVNGMSAVTEAATYGGGEPPPNNPPTADFTFVCTYLACDFTDTSTDSDGSVTGWAWDFGGDGASSAQNPSHTFSSAGSYNVQLTATDDDGDSHSTTKTVTVNEAPPNTPPTADFTFDCTYLACDFTDASTDSDGSVTGWAWDFGGDGASSAQNPSHTFSSAGSYDVQLTATDDDGDSNSTTKTVTVSEPPANQPPTASFTYDCTDLDCSFTDTSTDSDGTIASHSWTFGDGGTSTASDPSHSYGSAGTYTVTLTVTDNDGASDASSQDVTVSEPVAIEVSLVGRSIVTRNKWTAEVEDLNGNQLAGTWSVNGTASCSGSICRLSGLHVRKVKSVTFTETITGNGESIVVNQNP